MPASVMAAVVFITADCGTTAWTPSMDLTPDPTMTLYPAKNSGYSSRPMSKDSSKTRVFVVAITALCAVFLGSACSELQARRDIQQGDKLYEEGKYAEAIEVYEGALGESDLDIGHHNLAVAAFIAFQPGNTSPANLAYAKKASEHFQIYLRKNPKDNEIIELLTTVWLDSDQTDQALAFWMDVRKKDPKNPNALRQLGSIERLRGNYEEAIRWDYLRVEEATDPKKKVQILVGIGQLQYSRLAKKKEGLLVLMDEQRLQAADIGVAALQKAIAIAPKNASAHSLLATVYQYRSFAHLNGWGRLVDTASQRHHASIRDSLSKAKKKAPKPAPTAKDSAPEKGSGDETKGKASDTKPEASPETAGVTAKDEAKE